MGKINKKFFENRVLLLFSSIIDESQQKRETQCELFGGNLDCRKINPTPIIDWSFNNQKGFDLSEVQTLDFTKRRIRSFKRGLFTKFRNVSWIFLNENELNAVDFNEFENNTQLKGLNVIDNQISEIKPIKNPNVINITRMRLNGNDLKDISELCKLTKLKMLDLSRNRRLDFSTVRFNCWSELTELFLAATNLKNLNHNYRTLTGCNKLEYLNLMDNNLGMLCFERFPDLPNLSVLNIRNNSLIYLDVLGLKRRFKKISSIVITGNDWSCDFYHTQLDKQLKQFNITKQELHGFHDEKYCLAYSVDPEVRTCPKIAFSPRPDVLFWIIMTLNLVLFITVELLQIVILNLKFCTN
jgi:hypothetical protein